MSKGRAVLGMLVGVAAGTIVGILLAPEKGAITRKQIKGKSDDYLDELKSKFDEFSDLVSKKIDTTKNDVQYLAGKGKAKADNFKKDLKNAAADVEHSGY
ncbi:YtxH domain-containing protein [Marivirga salinae]|uniref:YtxH domain-containing protein n=1 Tax=Marivirga salinarum TaxID=3059078 RepID=A0AA49GBD3_9BACT|nr:YtxH domain-containing protein [Marivirga sp. BDSF4-3]WKK74728.1 YtxH domain-containing protein [Marivirga sp. BDSF4-3]